MTVPDNMQPSGLPHGACESNSMMLKQRCSSCLWHRGRTETDECLGSRGHLAASVQTDHSFTILLLSVSPCFFFFFFSIQTSDQALPIETSSCKARGSTNRPTPSYFSFTVSPDSVHHALVHLPFLCLPFCLPFFSYLIIFFQFRVLLVIETPS